MLSNSLLLFLRTLMSKRFISVNSTYVLMMLISIFCIYINESRKGTSIVSLSNYPFDCSLIELADINIGCKSCRVNLK